MNFSFPTVFEMKYAFYFIHSEEMSWCMVKIKEFENGSCVLYGSDIMEFSGVTVGNCEINQSG